MHQYCRWQGVCWGVLHLTKAAETFMSTARGGLTTHGDPGQ
ncbi:unnamed protein product [Staurois parvus]|uniref:Uncharacterized protein n=1 Tax=Staurois parvus TaxID=386267 RepID=A0ABN9GT55_9NEOB|nr:unnamed protein product [Staurois parvus]